MLARLPLGRLSGPRPESRLVLQVLLLALVPTIGLLWFVGLAIRNEQLASRQRLVEAYRPQLKRLAQRMEQTLRQRSDRVDLMLPGMNGYEICRQLRNRQVGATIIMVTAKGQEEDVVRGLELGADDYVTKPFSIRELLARANAFMRRRRRPVTTRIRFGKFVLDSQAHTLHRSGEEIELTRKEFQLLEYLLTNAGRALSRNDILNAVWGHHVIVTPRSVDRCITTLRAKIESHPDSGTLIHTIRDVGYRFELAALDEIADEPEAPARKSGAERS